MRNGDLRLLSAGITRNIHLEAENGALREFVEQLQSRVGELQEPRRSWLYLLTGQQLRRL